MKTGLFQYYRHCWVFQIGWHIECSTFTASSFRIWNSWTGIPSPPLALFIVMLPKAHLTLHSRMSGSGWVIIPLWLSGSWRSFLYSSSVYSCHVFLISSDSEGSGWQATRCPSNRGSESEEVWVSCNRVWERAVPELGHLLSCVAKDPVLSQPSTLPHWQCDSKAHLELQELRLHLMEEALPSCMALFGNSSFPEAPSRLSLVARWSGQGHLLPLHWSLQRKKGWPWLAYTH